jgi:sugar phosphate isomerase/epimerase
MKLGFLTACLPKMRLEELVSWAAGEGFDALELAAWPVDSDRDYLAHHIDAVGLTVSLADRIRASFEEYGLDISALAYYDNNLHPDAVTRSGLHAHLKKVIDAASMLRVELVGTFVGARPDRTPVENIREIGTVFREMVRYAEDHGVKLMIENCPMENWVQFGLPGNYAFSPELWDALFEEVPSESFGLNLDPSHLHWLGIDPVAAVERYAGRIFHAHAKDAEILPSGRHHVSVLARQLGDNPWDSGWWRYRMPGRGQVDWPAFVAALRGAGYNHVLSIEHEDPDYEGDAERIKEGLRLGLHALRPIIESS